MSLFHSKAFPPFLKGIAHSDMFRLGVMARLENLLAGVADSAAAVQREDNNAFAVNAAFNVA